ncbi:N-glycosylation protein-domain-containing protein [Pseudomassariella vexata]|uniref:N-glycosylation protein-domain-containing protein n=1 Tax=Pseudomassariella vexata TaxID=1141098 RepID=A0A1Y2E8T6_9PEZI|nr:N-glycosylation protein-domain-containing protein [Pseudomassariella vexata]ORY67696.1 N-glycosylation protein-domain-containing protein [Pseudomassariella vexata]
MARPSPEHLSSFANHSSNNHGPTNNEKQQAVAVAEAIATSSLLQPRMAVVLGVPARWHPFLFACRLLSIAPTLWWGVRCALGFLVADFLENGLWSGENDHVDGRGGGSTKIDNRGERRLMLTETALAIIWCAASAYLSYFFTDCLMSRWLLNYTPQATIVRLLTLSSIFAFVASNAVSLTGGTADPSLLLPAWIGMAWTLTACYHFTQRKINIRKETSASISVFSLASFVSMVALLVHLHLMKDEYPPVPLWGWLRRAGEIAGRILVAVLDVKRRRDLEV